jgi:hypothetical protein
LIVDILGAHWHLSLNSDNKDFKETPHFYIDNDGKLSEINFKIPELVRSKTFGMLYLSYSMNDNFSFKVVDFQVLVIIFDILGILCIDGELFAGPIIRLQCTRGSKYLHVQQSQRGMIYYLFKYHHCLFILYIVLIIITIIIIMTHYCYIN